MIDFFRATVYEPLLNTLFFFLSVVPGADVGIAVVCLTIIVKIFLTSVSHRATLTMRRMQELQPEFQNIKNRKLAREAEAREMIALYKKHNINPLAGLGSILVVLVQIPIVISLYYVFMHGLAVPPEVVQVVDAAGRIPSSSLATSTIEKLYSFTPLPPEFIHVTFLGLIDLTGKSMILALLVAATQYILARFMAAKMPVPKSDFAKSWNIQMRYFLPIVMGVVAYTISAAVALYFLVGNLVSLVYEYTLARQKTLTPPAPKA